MNVTSYHDLIVWQKAIDFVVDTYRLTGRFPRTELYGLISQLQRAVVSIPSNIAEGAGVTPVSLSTTSTFRGVHCSRPRRRSLLPSAWVMWVKRTSSRS